MQNTIEEKFINYFKELDYPSRQSVLAYLNALDDDINDKESGSNVDISKEFRNARKE